MAAETATMRAAVIEAYGPASAFHIADLSVPTPGEGEVLVHVHAAGVNAIDWLTRAGLGVGLTVFPASLGWDISGTVSSIGPGVTTLREGDEVFGMPRFPEAVGAYAQYVTAPADSLAVKPDTIGHHVAAAAPMAALTAWHTLFQHGRLSAGQRVLIHGAAGGVGHVAVQLAKLTGAEVIATASARNHDFVTELGADRVVDYTQQLIEDVVTDVDVVVDTRGGDDFDRLLGVLSPGGVLVTLKGSRPDHADLAKARNVRVAHTYVAPDGIALSRISALLADKKLRIEVEQVLPLAEAATAHTIGETGHVRGRLVLSID